MPLKTNPPEKDEEKSDKTNQPCLIVDPTLFIRESFRPVELDG